MKICTIVGARPQFIKAAVLSRLISGNDAIEEIMIHTGQHYDHNMSDVFFNELSIKKPKYNLDIHGSSHGASTGRMIEKIEEILISENPDWVLLYGDTNSTLAGAIAASKLGINIAHVEAGLRSYDKGMPEELNRVMVDHCSDLLFSPTDQAVKNLKKEGFEDDKIFKTGDIMYDSILYYKDKSKDDDLVLGKYKIKKKEYVLVTIHRQSNTDKIENLKAIIQGLSTCEKQMLLPLHPRTKKIIEDKNIVLGANIKVIDPVGYVEMIMLQKNAYLIATDSGGIQKEAFFNHVPCVTLRDTTEWTELLDLKVNSLVGADAMKIKQALQKDYSYINWHELPLAYGDGASGKEIIKRMEEYK